MPLQQQESTAPGTSRRSRQQHSPLKACKADSLALTGSEGQDWIRGAAAVPWMEGGSCNSDCIATTAAGVLGAELGWGLGLGQRLHIEQLLFC